MHSSILYSIESFPPMRESIVKINKLCDAPEVDLKALAQIIESDPVLYVNILHYSNAPRYGFHTPITSISQAITLFGVAEIRGMAITAAMKAHPFTDVSPYGVSMNKWFSVMESQQHFITLFLKETNPDILQKLGGVTFILEIGRLVASYMLMLTDNPYQFSKTDPRDLLAEEKKVIGNTGDELAAKLFELWFFDDAFVDSLRFSLNPSHGLEPKICAMLMCARLLFTLSSVNPFDTIKPVLTQYDLSESDAKKAYEQVLKDLY